MENLFTAIMPYLISIAGAVAAYVVAVYKQKQTQVEIDELNSKIVSGNFYVICPKCKTRIYLAETEMHKVADDEPRT